MIEKRRGAVTLKERAKASLRAWQQERRIRSEQAEYEALARKGGVHVVEGASLAEAIGKRLASRGISLPPGEPVHTLIATNLDIWEEHNLLPALRELGPVTVFNMRDGDYRPFTPDWREGRRRLNADLLEFTRRQARESRPHIFFTCATGYTFFPETIDEIGKLGMATCGYFWDDRLIFRGDWYEGQWSGPASVAGSFDLCLTNAAASRIKYFVEGGRALFWPLGANPDVFRPLDLPRDIPVSFLGAAYGARPIWIEKLRERGVDVLALGPGWPSGPVPLEEMIEVYSRSRICLGFSGIGYSMKEFCLKGRDIEVPMAGTVYLTPSQQDLPRVFELDKEIVAFDGVDDCVAKISELLQQPERCEEIRKNARSRGLRDHTWKKRFSDLISLLREAPAGQT